MGLPQLEREKNHPSYNLKEEIQLEIIVCAVCSCFPFNIFCHGQIQLTWQMPSSLKTEMFTGFSLFWSVTLHHYSDATRSLLPALHGATIS